MSQSRVVFQNQWYVSLLLCSDEYRLLVVVVVLEEIKQTNQQSHRSFSPWNVYYPYARIITLGHYAKPRCNANSPKMLLASNIEAVNFIESKSNTVNTD